MDTAFKRPSIIRDEAGRFDRHGKSLAKTQKKSGLNIKKSDNQSLPEREPDGRLKNGGPRPGAGRPPGSKNKVSQSLREMILESLQEAGGKDYLAKLAYENSSAYASLIGKVLPLQHGIDAESSRGNGVIRFERVIVMADGTRWVDGVTPKQLAPPISSSLADDPAKEPEANEINDLDNPVD